jgi:putative PIG3 family NAD(P)H quinone oxidoreductase
MQAYVVENPGALRIREVQVPTPGAGEIRVRVRAFGINRADLLQRRGLYPAPPGAPPDILGLEFAGEVDSIGPDEVPGVRSTVEPSNRGGVGWAVGDRVMGITAGGSYAEYVVVPAGHGVAIPPGYSFSEAAAVPEAFVTAWDAFERLALAAGEWVLIHAVASGVGTAALQLAQARGARCVGTSRSREKLARAVEMGLDVGVDSSDEHLVADVRRATGGEGAHAVLDLVGGERFARTLEMMRPRGRLVLVGLTAGRTAEVDLGLVLRHRLRIEGTVLRSRSIDEKDELMARFRAAVLPLLAARTVRPVIDRVYPFAEVESTHAVMAANHNFGKLVVEVA